MFSTEKRSQIMSKVRNKDTKPEKKVRSMLHHMGYRFRLHRKDLPGTPDIVLPRHEKIVFVHGCFWHSHNCPRGKRPSTRREFWNEKLDGNIARDKAHRRELEALGWDVLTVWTCELKDLDSLYTKLQIFMNDERESPQPDEHRAPSS